jgi:hypothetical protein
MVMSGYRGLDQVMQVNCKNSDYTQWQHQSIMGAPLKAGQPLIILALAGLLTAPGLPAQDSGISVTISEWTVPWPDSRPRGPTGIEDDKDLACWVDMCSDFVSSLPPK